MQLVKLLLLLIIIHLNFLLSAQDRQPETDTSKKALNTHQVAEFPGGRKAMLSFFENNIVYPPSAIKDSISGKVRLAFTIDKNGKVKEVRVLKGIRADLNAEAIRVLKLMPVWKPSLFFGKPIRQKLHIPVKFTLPTK